MKVCRRVTFNSAHRLFNPHWSDEKNFEVFGKCSNHNYHGHNYVLETWIEGPVDEETGWLDIELLGNIFADLDQCFTAFSTGAALGLVAVFDAG
jgi:6-pyruvoyltetrahydropterin/6-carboxytetrahydropterin synthase